MYLVIYIFAILKIGSSYVYAVLLNTSWSLSFVTNWPTSLLTKSTLFGTLTGDDASSHVVGEAGDVADAEGVGPEHGDLPRLAAVQLRHPLYLAERNVVSGLVTVPGLVYTCDYTLSVL